MNYTEVQKHYDRLEYKAVDGRWYKFVERWPICMKVAKHRERIYVDTGGQMQNCSFDILELCEDGFVYKLDLRMPQKMRKLKTQWRVNWE